MFDPEKHVTYRVNSLHDSEYTLSNRWNRTGMLWKSMEDTTSYYPHHPTKTILLKERRLYDCPVLDQSLRCL
jgi:hypothetical protein